MSNEYFNPSGSPGTGAAGASATMRSEFTSVAAGFALLPTMAANGNKVVTVNAGGTALIATSATALSGMTIGTNVQAWDADLDAIAALTSAADKLPYSTGAQAWALTTFTAAARSLLDDASTAAMVATLGISVSSGSSLVGFLQTGTGAVATTLQARGRLEVWAEDFGAVGDGVTDDTTAINAAITYVAITGGVVLFASKDYLVTSIVLKVGVALRGTGGQKLSGLHGTRLLGTAGSDIITFPSGNISDVGVVGMELSGGRRSIAYDGGGYIVEFHLEDLRFSAPSAECIYIQGQSERQFFKYLHFSQGTYAYYHGKGSLAHGIFEKSTWEHLYCETQSINGIFWDDITTSGSLSATFIKVISAGQHGVRIKGNFDGMTWIGWNFEANGTTGAGATTTGTINSTSTSLVVASATGFAISDPITVAGAGTSGEDLTTTITNIVGTTFTLNDAAGTSVVAASTTNRSYDDISLEVSNASNLILIGCYPGAGNGNGKIRYGLNNASGGCKNITMIGCSGVTTAPVYDPRRRITLINSTTGVRQPTGFGNERFNVMTLPGVASLAGASPESRRTLIPSPSGKDLILGLADSVGNGTGTLGTVSVYGSYGSPTEIFRVEGTLPADGKTCAYVLRNVGGTFTLQQITMGAADSGGAGFKVLRVAN